MVIHWRQMMMMVAMMMVAMLAMMVMMMMCINEANKHKGAASGRAANQGDNDDGHRT